MEEFIMAVHLQDEQEIANFKYFWQHWGRWLFGLLVLLALAYFGWVMYQNHTHSNSEKAAVVFETFVEQSQANHIAESKKTLIKLQEDYPDTIKAAQATLMMAATTFNQGKYDETVKHLQWVKAKQSSDLIQAITAQRLAVTFLQQKKYTEALNALDVKIASQFEPMLLDTKGDVLLAQQKTKEAIAAYQKALDLSSQDNPLTQLLKMKLDTLS